MVQIITDSSCLYTAEEAKSLGFESLPLTVSIGDLDGRDLQIDMKDYYGRIAQGQIPKTSQPPIGEVVEMYEKYADKEIINIAMADGLSGTYQSACGARELVDNKERITVINTKTLCGPHRYLVEKAQEMKEKGHTAREIIDWLEEKIERTESFLIPQDFSFLKRGGRLTPVAATLGSVLKLKPVMCQTKDGKKLDKFCVKRTMSGAIKAVIEHLKKRELGARHLMYISHAEALKDALLVKEQLLKAFPELEIKILELSPVFVAQGGPQCVAIQYIEK